SANDSAVVIAENLAGSEENFVKKMNEKAKELNMTNTLFVDSSGLNEDGYSTARDVAILSKCVLNNELYKKYSKIWLDSYTHPSGRETELANTNKLLRKYDKCIAGKTGTTEKAGYCFTALCDNNGFKLISVVLGANTTNDRFDLAKELFLTGYANFKYVQLYEKDSFYNEIAIKNAKDNLTKTYVKDEIGIVTAKNEELNVAERVVLYDIKAPLSENTSVGCVEFIQGDEIIAKVEIYVKDFVAKENYFNVIEKIIANW
ncbi:MAG: D-alanyl-D-alanine carboxypeptidase family protein, partial [Christensenellales bacterium]